MCIGFRLGERGQWIKGATSFLICMVVFDAQCAAHAIASSPRVVLDICDCAEITHVSSPRQRAEPPKNSTKRVSFLITAPLSHTHNINMQVAREPSLRIHSRLPTLFTAKKAPHSATPAPVQVPLIEEGHHLVVVGPRGVHTHRWSCDCACSSVVCSACTRRPLLGSRLSQSPSRSTISASYPVCGPSVNTLLCFAQGFLFCLFVGVDAANSKPSVQHQHSVTS